MTFLSHPLPASPSDLHRHSFGKSFPGFSGIVELLFLPGRKGVREKWPEIRERSWTFSLETATAFLSSSDSGKVGKNKWPHLSNSLNLQSINWMFVILLSRHAETPASQVEGARPIAFCQGSRRNDTGPVGSLGSADCTLSLVCLGCKSAGVCRMRAILLDQFV